MGVGRRRRDRLQLLSPRRRRLPAALAALAAALALGGCAAAGEPGGTKTFSDRGVPFTFEVPVDFTKASVDEGATRGDVVAAAGISKLDVIAVRRVGAEALPSGPVAHVVRGQRVTSELHRAPGGYAIECQYTPARAQQVRDACRTALRTIRRR